MKHILTLLLQGWSDIGYSFLVGGDGNVYEGRGWSYVGAHTQNYNSKSFAASMIGSFESSLPNSKALSGELTYPAFDWYARSVFSFKIHSEAINMFENTTIVLILKHVLSYVSTHVSSTVP